MFPCSQVTIKYLKLIEKGELEFALNLLKETATDNSEMYVEAAVLSCRYYVIVNNKVINLPTSERMIQLNKLSLAMIDLTKYYGYLSNFAEA